jgi:hypothetical protein
MDEWCFVETDQLVRSAERIVMRFPKAYDLVFNQLLHSLESRITPAEKSELLRDVWLASCGRSGSAAGRSRKSADGLRSAA